jgi:hypothetical protein
MQLKTWTADAARRRMGEDAVAGYFAKVALRFAAGIDQVLALDTASIAETLRVEVVRRTKRHIFLTSTDGYRAFREECQSRQGAAWDQPLGWVRSAMAAERAVNEAMIKLEATIEAGDENTEE